MEKTAHLIAALVAQDSPWFGSITVRLDDDGSIAAWHRLEEAALWKAHGRHHSLPFEVIIHSPAQRTILLPWRHVADCAEAVAEALSTWFGYRVIRG